MQNKKLSEKSNKGLLIILDSIYKGQIQSDNTSINQIIKELNARNLTDDERNEYNALKSWFIENGNKITEDEGLTRMDKNENSVNFNIENSIDIERYIALKTLSIFISLCGYILIILGIIAMFYFLITSEKSFGGYGGLIGFVFLISSIVISIPLLAFSNLIYVLIDTEANTRNTNKLINILLNKS